MSHQNIMQQFAFLTHDPSREKQWREEWSALVKGLPEVFMNFKTILIDAQHPAWRMQVKKMDTEDKWVMLVVGEKDFLPDPADLHLVHDFLVYPFRLGEMVSKVKHARLHFAARELEREAALASQEAGTSLDILERIVAAKTPKRFEGIRGLNIMSRHLTGLKPGGDYFDVFESESKDQINFLLCDSSSYGLSSALLGLILSSSARLASDAKMNTSDWIRAIYQELSATLKQTDHLSIFFGRLNRRDFSLQYQLFGSIEAFLVERTGECHPLQKSGGRIQSQLPPPEAIEKKIYLNPKDRLVLLSDGFVNGVGGEFTLHQFFKQKLNQEPFYLVNALAYQIKSKLTPGETFPGETFPGEDCSAIVVDVEQGVLRLAPATGS